MRGPGVESGERAGLQITDVGPTVLARIGVAVPAEMIGTPVSAAR